MADSVWREQTPDEKMEYVSIHRNEMKSKPMNRFYSALADIEQEAIRKKQPICTTCAENDFRDMLEAENKMFSRKIKMRQEYIPKDILSNFDFSNYIGEDKFDKVNVSPVNDKVRTGIGVGTELIGYNVDYKCKTSGHNRTVFWALSEWKDWGAKPKPMGNKDENTLIKVVKEEEE